MTSFEFEYHQISLFEKAQAKIKDMKCNGYFVAVTPDCGPNLGGYYCQVYEDEDMTSQLDDFCIHPEELRINPNIDYWINQQLQHVYCPKCVKEHSNAEMMAVCIKKFIEANNEEDRGVYPLKELEPWMLDLVPSGKYMIEISKHVMVLKPTLLKIEDVPIGHHFYHFMIGNTIYSGVFVGTELE